MMNKNINKYIEYLSFLHLDPMQENWSTNFMACNTKSNLPSINRVYIPEYFLQNEYCALQNYYGETNFTFWVDQENKKGNDSVKDVGGIFHKTFPLMHIDINKIIFSDNNKYIRIEELHSKDVILFTWAPLVAKSFGIIDLIQFQKYISYLISTSQSKNILFWMGYYSDQPCAASMFILRNDIAGIHWVGTLPEFRNLGLGHAMTCNPMNILKSTINEAILYSSEMGRPIYEKIGFTEVCKVNVYNAPLNGN